MAGKKERQAGRTVLLVDDDPGVVEILGVNLARARFQVISAGSGAQALSRASSEIPDIILLDACLPDLDGLDVCRRLKEDPPTRDIPVVMLSEDVDTKDVIAGLAAGAEDYVHKPLGPSEVVALVETHVKRVAQDRDANHVTGLPGYIQVGKRIAAMIRESRPFAIMYAGIDYPEGFEVVYGAVQGERAVRLLAEIIRDALQLFGGPDDLAGHGEDGNLVVVTTPESAETLCRRIIADFDGRVGDLHLSEVLEDRHLAHGSRLAWRESAPIMTVSIAVVTSRGRSIKTCLQAGRIGAELTEFVRSLPGSNYCFDRRQDSAMARRRCATRGAPDSHRQDVRSVRRAVSWIAFLAKETCTPIASMEGDLHLLLRDSSENLDSGQISVLESIQKGIGRLAGVLGEIDNLGSAEWDAMEASLDQVDLTDVLDRVAGLVQANASELRVEVSIRADEDVPPLMADEWSLVRGLFYLLRGLVGASSPGHCVHVRVLGEKGPFIAVEMVNPDCRFSPRELAVLFRGDQESTSELQPRNDFHLAMMLVRSIGGELKVKGRDGLGTTFAVFIPRRWRSGVGQISRVQSTVEGSGQEVRAQIEGIRQLISSGGARSVSAVAEGLESLELKVRELEALCNLSLLMADDLSSDLERQSGRILEQDADGLHALEAILVLAGQIAGAERGRHGFDLDSARRVSRCALAIAAELRLHRRERLTLHYAALLKDLDVLLSIQRVSAQRGHVTEDMDAGSVGFPATVKETLSRVEFLQPALSVVARKYERFNGFGSSFGPRGSEIPLGSRILAVAETFETMISGSSPAGGLDPEAALKELAADSCGRFDPAVVGALLRAWRSGRVRLNAGEDVR